MTSTLRSLTLGLSASLVLLCGVAQAPAAAQERFEIASIKSIRPTLVNTIGALQQRDAARAKDAFAVNVRALDAIHVATALGLASSVGVLVTYDERMRGAAVAVGLVTAAP